jgi:twitching motility protein PilU
MIITPLLKLAVERNASDLLFSVDAPITIKIDGVSKPINDQRVDAESARRIAYEMMTPDQIAQFEREMEMNFSFRVPEVGSFRVNVFRQKGDISMAIRYVRAKVLKVEELSLPIILKSLVMEKRGLILVVGATSSGKSTTLAYILTIEDPIEYLFKHNKSVINQREIGTDTHSYEAALISAMREAPDVVMIGEIRERETLKHALITAQTGHLCLSTLHANNSYHALNRIINFFPYDARASILSDLSQCMKAVISQRLVRNIQGKLIPVVEVLINSSLIADLIKSGEIEKIRDAIEQSVSPGSQTFEQALYQLFRKGQITKEEALRNADSASNLSAMIDYSETSKMKAYNPNDPANQAPIAKSQSVDFGAIKLNIDGNQG